MSGLTLAMNGAWAAAATAETSLRKLMSRGERPNSMSPMMKL